MVLTIQIRCREVAVTSGGPLYFRRGVAKFESERSCFPKEKN